MQLIEYKDVSVLLDLNIEDKEFDELCLNSAYREIEKQINYSLDEKECFEIQTVKDNRVILAAISISQINEVTDLNTKCHILNFSIDYENKSIYFVPCKVEGHIMYINYTAGFSKENFPCDLKDAVIKLFLYKQKTIGKMNNNEKCEIEFPEDIQITINRYCKKGL